MGPDKKNAYPASLASIGAVVIGRNEGVRLQACLSSLTNILPRVVYVDSGSSDDSVKAARAFGATVVELDMSQPFTAARARNAGLKELNRQWSPDLDHVQFVDGDCTVDAGWIAHAHQFLQEAPEVAAVCGRRRERFPDASRYNAMCDAEWDTPIGETKACGGDVMMRLHPVLEQQGYREDLIAGEEPELCVRLRGAGWKIWRLDAEMTLHDAQMMHFSQWWKRARRAGHAYAEGASLHGAPPEEHWVKETRRAVLWGAALPIICLTLTLGFGPLGLLSWLIFIAQWARLRRRTDSSAALFSVLGKFAEAQGLLEFYLNQWRGRRRGLIEYK